jgi:tetratricopeptide (TPR) repeat protein
VDAAAANLDLAASSGGRFDTKPLVEARIRTSLGWTYLNLREFPEAIRHYGRARELQVRELGESSRESLASARALGSLFCETRQLERAEACLARALELARDSLGSGDRETLYIQTILGNVVEEQGRVAESIRIREEVLRGCRKHLSPGDTLTIGAVGNLANAVWAAGRLDEAEALLLETLDAATRFLGPDDFMTLNQRANLGTLYVRMGRTDRAVNELSQALEGWRRTLPPLDSTFLKPLSDLVRLHAERGDAQAARPLTTEILAILEKRARLAPQDPLARNDYAWNLLSAYPEDLHDPATALEQSLAACEATNFENWNFLDTLALALHRTGNTAEAIERQRRALELCPAGAPARRDMEMRLAEYESASREH